jgi:hypothetical protein
MSTIISANVSDGTLSIPTTFVTNGSAKAWVNFNGTGTIAARDSLNVSSLTDNGTGNYLANFSSAMGNGNYSVSGAVAGGTTGMLYSRRLSNAAFRGTSSFGGLCLFAADTSGGGGLADYDEVDMKAHGDLA